MIVKSKISKNIWISFVINCVVIIVLSLISYPQYESDIDIIMQVLLCDLSGAGTTNKLVFMNTFIGSILEFFVNITTQVPWYMIFQYFCIYIALFLICYIILEENNGWLGIVVSCIVSVFSGYECYIRLGYIKTSAIVCVATVYLLFFVIERDKKNRFFNIFVCMGFLLTSMISWTAFLICTSISAVCFVLYFLLNDLKKLVCKQLVITCFVSFIVCVGGRVIDNQMYNEDIEWKKVLEYRNGIEKVRIFGMPEYSAELQRILKIDEIQYNNFVDGTYIPMNYSTIDLINRSAKIYKNISLYEILNFFRIVPIRMLQVGMFFCFVILCWISHYSVKKEKKKMFIMSICVLVLSYFAFYCVNAWNSPFTNVLIYFPLCMFILMNCKELKTKDIDYVMAYIMVLIIMLYSNFSHLITTAVDKNPMDAHISWQIDPNILNAINLNKILKGCSAYANYISDLINYDQLLLVNGDYYVFPNFRKFTSITSRDIERGCVWINDERNNEEIFIE